MTDNHKKAKEWLDLAFSNLNRVIRSYKQRDYPISVFLIQLSIEQLQKSTIFLIGLQFRKTHEPSKILESIVSDTSFKIDNNLLKIIKNIAARAKKIELEGAFTRYGELKGDTLLTPEEKYNKSVTKSFLSDLKEILIDINIIFKMVPNFEDYCKLIQNYIKKIIKLLRK